MFNSNSEDLQVTSNSQMSETNETSESSKFREADYMVRSLTQTQLETVRTRVAESPHLLYLAKGEAGCP